MNLSILVTGDVIVDHHIYEGQTRLATSLMRSGTHHQMTGGGAQLLVDLLETYKKQFPKAKRNWQESQAKRLKAARKAASEKKESKGLSAEETRKYQLGAPFHNLRVECGLSLTDLEKLKDYPHLNGCGLLGLFPAEPRLDEPCPCETPSKAAKVWRLKEPLGYGSRDPKNLFTPQPATDVLSKPHKVWLIDDAGLDYRVGRSSNAWPPALRGKGDAVPDWLILKMSAPLACGDLWRTIAANRYKNKQIAPVPLIKRTVVVVSAEDVRCETARISRGVSWERTALDLVKAIQETPALRQLARCRQLIVLFGAEGAALVDGRIEGSSSVHLVFDAVNQEGDWTDRVEGDVFGKMSCFVAGVLSRLPTPTEPGAVPKPNDRPTQDAEIMGLIEGIRTGLHAVRCLISNGHRTEHQVGLPLEEIASDIQRLEPTVDFDHVLVPNDIDPGLFSSQPIAVPQAGPAGTATANSRVWRILEGAPDRQFGRAGLIMGHARLVSQFGLKKLPGIPCLSLGELKTVDRGEIESLRNIKQLMEDYREDGKAKRPLSIGVFGQPGSGKSFGVKQIAKAVLHDAPVLEFNLSQLSEQDELVLIGAFHQIRDKVLKGQTPVVFWDEFDARDLHWLAKLLAPMQDGTFLEGQMVRPVGKCIFVFAGGTSYDFASFGPPAFSDEELQKLSSEQRERLAEEQQLFRARKGPDFKSRLTAYLDVAGPNQRRIRDWVRDRYDLDLTDTGYPLRRALLLRSQLGVKDDKTLDIDAGLLTALLEVREYRHGARSIEKVVEQLKVRGRGRRYVPSHVPPDEILDLHVNAGEFRELLERDYQFHSAAERIAPCIHDAYLKGVTKKDSTVHAVVRKRYNELFAEYQEDNIAAARRMTDVLAVAGLMLENSADRQPTPDAVKAHIQQHIDILAEAEHMGWNEYKMKNGWSYATDRNEGEKHHDCLLAFSQLPREQQDKDRQQVSNYAAFAEQAGYRIVFRNRQ